MPIKKDNEQPRLLKRLSFLLFLVKINTERKHVINAQIWNMKDIVIHFTHFLNIVSEIRLGSISIFDLLSYVQAVEVQEGSLYSCVFADYIS